MKKLLLAALFAFAPTLAFAQSQWITPSPGEKASGVVQMCLNSSGQAVPVSSGSCQNPAVVNAPTGATAVTAQVSCATTATALLAADTTKAVRSIANNSGATVFLGPSGVTTSTGIPIATGQGFDASHLTGALYCIVASSTATLGTIQY
jgi:hypothetical protein